MNLSTCLCCACTNLLGILLVDFVRDGVGIVAWVVTHGERSDASLTACKHCGESTELHCLYLDRNFVAIQDTPHARSLVEYDTSVDVHESLAAEKLSACFAQCNLRIASRIHLSFESLVTSWVW